jgi:hypothetical protein
MVRKHEMKSRGSRTRRLQAVVLAAAVCVPGVPQAAAGSQGTPASPARQDAVTASVGDKTTVTSTSPGLITGSAWKADNSPIPYARLRLRNIVTGLTRATTTADEEGRFAFADVPAGTYVVELLSDSGKVLAIGHPFAVSAGESAVTFVRLSGQASFFSGLFGSAALAVAAAAAATGLTALAPEQVRPVSGRQ